MPKKRKAKARSRANKPTAAEVAQALDVLMRADSAHFSRYFKRDETKEIGLCVVVGRCQFSAQAAYDAFDAIQATHDALHEAKQDVAGVSAVQAPGILQDAPRAEDVEADRSAPTITMATFLGWFKRMPDIRIVSADALPPWCSAASLSLNVDEDRGRLLNFVLTGEKTERVCWVRE